MGCDIHLYCEQKYKDDWYSADNYRINASYGEYDLEPKLEVVHLYDGRDYILFSILADVRNYSNNDYISKPKGIPNDISEGVKKELEKWHGDSHSHSYFTAKELFEWLKTHNTTKYSGMISAEDVKKLDEDNILPTSWCQWTNIIGYEYREWVEEKSHLEYLVDKIKERMTECFNIYSFYSDDKKEELINSYAENFRIVFWFDN